MFSPDRDDQSDESPEQQDTDVLGDLPDACVERVPLENAIIRAALHFKLPAPKISQDMIIIGPGDYAETIVGLIENLD